MLAAMHKYVVISETDFPAPLVERLQLQRLLPLAIDRAIFENLPALSERASSVACNTTAELILKVCGNACVGVVQVMWTAESISLVSMLCAMSDNLPAVCERTSPAELICKISGSSCGHD